MSHYMKASKKSFSRNVQEFIIRPLLRQRETGELCDLTIKLNGRHFNAHKAILSLWSPYFLSMFTCDMRERLTREVDLSESLILERDDVFATVLDYMYTGSITLTVDNVEDIVKISDFLLIDDVKEYCRQFYMDLGNLDLSNCLRLKFLAEDHNMPEVAKYCQKMIESRFHDYVIYHDEILDLPPPCIFRLLEDSHVVQHTSYNELKKVVQHWVDLDRMNRQQYYLDLMICVKHWISDYANEASYLGREMSTSDILRRSMEGSFYDVLRKSTEGSLPDNQHRSMEGSLSGIGAAASPGLDHISSSDMSEKQSPSDSIPVILAVVCNQGLKFMKILIYGLNDQKWYQFPVSGEKMLHYMPVRQTVCNMVLSDNKLFMYLCSSFPYPTDMMKINILVTDLVTGQPTLFSFRTVDFYNPCYRTTLTNIRTAPPVMVSCNNQLYVLGNKEGTGHLFMCNLATHQYTCFQIPGCRFISLGRATVKDDRHIYIWFRHRTGPSEEFCIKKSVGLAVFDTRTKIFSSWELPPPEISYDEFSKPYVLCVREDTVFIYHPGQPALLLDEVRCKWITSIRRISMPYSDFSPDTQAYGFQLLVPTQDSIFILNNESPYTTSMHEVSEKYPCSMAHIPPPIDHISVIAMGSVPKTMMQSVDKCSHYDDAYSSALHVALQYSDGESDDSAASHCEEPDSENDYEYDEDIYDYDYEVDVSYDF